MDLRPRKRQLGIIIANPTADIRELRARLATQTKGHEQTAKPEEKKEEAPNKKNERSWLSRLFVRTAAAAPAPQQSADHPAEQQAGKPAAASPARPAEIPEQPKASSAAPVAAPIELELPLSALTAPAAEPPPAAPIQSSEMLGEEIEPDLSLNDFLSELERFQTSPEFDAKTDAEAEESPADADGGGSFDEEDRVELPDFDLEEGRDLLAEFSAQDGAAAEALEDSDDAPLFASPPAATQAEAGLSAADPHEIAMDDLIGSMAHGTSRPVDEEEEEEDALFAPLSQNRPPTNPLDDFALSLEEHIEDAMSAAADLAETDAFETVQNETPDSPDQEPAPEYGQDEDEPADAEGEEDGDETIEHDAPVQAVTPDVMEFDEDDAILEQQLDELLGDLVLDVTAVKSAKPAANPASSGKDSDDDSFYVDGDLEISFEIEDEDGQDQEDGAADGGAGGQEQAADGSGRSDQILDQLLEAFNRIDSDTEHKSIASLPADAKLVPAGESIDLHKMLVRLRSAAETGSPNLINELLEQLARGYGIDSHLLRDAVAPAMAQPEQAAEQKITNGHAQDSAAPEMADWEKTARVDAAVDHPAIADSAALAEPGDLLDLSSELDRELAALSAEGTTIFGEAPAPVVAPAQPEPAAIDADLAALESELDQELSLLEKEGTSLISSQPTAEVQAAAPDSGDLEQLSNELDSELAALGAEGTTIFAEEAAVPAQPAEEVVVAPADDLSALQNELDSELAALSAEGTSFHHQATPAPQAAEPAEAAPSEALPPEIEPADELAEDPDLAALTRELDTELALLASEGTNIAAEDEAPVETAPTAETASAPEPAMEFEPTQTGAFLIGDLAALEPPPGPEAAPDSEAAAVETEDAGDPTGVSPAAEASAPAIEQFDESIADLAAELDQELALLQAEGMALSHVEDPDDEIDLGDLEQFESPGEPNELPASSIEAAQVPAETAPAEEPAQAGLDSEIDNSPTATGIFLAADLETILANYGVTAPVEAAAPEDELLADISLDQLEQAEAQVSAAEAPVEAAAAEAAADPQPQAGVPAEPAAPPPVESPFNPEEVSIEPAEEAQLNFSRGGAEAPSGEPADQQAVPAIEAGSIAQEITEPPAENAVSAAPESSAVEPPVAESPAQISAENQADEEKEDEKDDDDNGSVNNGSADEDGEDSQFESIPAELWEAALADPELEMLDMEIEAAELCDVGPTARLDMLFNLAEEELLAGGQAQEYVEAAPTSINRELIDAGLKRAVHRYEVEVHEELKRSPVIREQRDEAPISIEQVISAFTMAPLWRRGAALVFDLTVSLALACAAAYFLVLDPAVANKISNGEIPSVPEALPFAAAAAAFAWILWTIFNVLPASESGQTRGQRLFGIAVFDFEGNTPGFYQVFTRTMLETTTLMTFGLGILPALGRSKQMLHDRLAKTVVVRLSA